MTICSAGHSGLYYPQDPSSLASEAAPMERIECRFPKALLLPHAAWSHCLPLLHHGLAHTRGLEAPLIVLLAPYHGVGKNLPVMVPKSDALAVGNTTIPFATDVRAHLASRFPLTVSDTPFEDESSWELLMPLIASYHPDVPILPILSSELTGEHRLLYASLLAQIHSLWPSALYIVTSNANEPLPSPKAEADAIAFRTSLTAPVTGGHAPLSACNQSALAALARQQWAGDARWRIIAQMCERVIYDEIPSSLDIEERHVWHNTAILEES